MSRAVLSTISRLGKQVDVLTRTSSSSDAFNNPESSWSKKTTTRCVRTYPNRNTQVDGRGGPRNRDHPVFLFANEQAPPANSRIVYEGTTYELQSPTVYDSHVAIFGELVSE